MARSADWQREFRKTDEIQIERGTPNARRRSKKRYVKIPASRRGIGQNCNLFTRDDREGRGY